MRALNTSIPVNSSCIPGFCLYQRDPLRWFSRSGSVSWWKRVQLALQMGTRSDGLRDSERQSGASKVLFITVFASGKISRQELRGYFRTRVFGKCSFRLCGAAAARNNHLTSANRASTEISFRFPFVLWPQHTCKPAAFLHEYQNNSRVRNFLTQTLSVLNCWSQNRHI